MYEDKLNIGLDKKAVLKLPPNVAQINQISVDARFRDNGSYIFSLGDQHYGNSFNTIAVFNCHHVGNVQEIMFDFKFDIWTEKNDFIFVKVDCVYKVPKNPKNYYVVLVDYQNQQTEVKTFSNSKLLRSFALDALKLHKEQVVDKLKPWFDEQIKKLEKCPIEDLITIMTDEETNENMIETGDVWEQVLYL